MLSLDGIEKAIAVAAARKRKVGVVAGGGSAWHWEQTRGLDGAPQITSAHLKLNFYDF